MAKTRKKIHAIIGLALWARAAGRCELCGKELNAAHAFDILGNYAQVAHINAYSEGGPRHRDGLSDEELNDIDNLMLLCHEHHKMIDDRPDLFPEETLRKHKSFWEDSIAEFVENLAPTETMVATLALPVGGMRPCVTPMEVRSALRGEGLYAVEHRAFDCAEGVAASSCLQDAASQIERRVSIFKNMFDNRTMPVSVFALAPQPLLIKLGSLLGGVRDLRIFQPSRAGRGWEWPDDGALVEFQIRCIRDGQSDASSAAVIISLSGAINMASIEDIPKSSAVYELTVPDPSIEIACHRDTPGTFAEKATSLIDGIHEKYPNVSELHVYPAMPASLAVAFGTVLRFNLIGNYVVHEKADGSFGETLCIRRSDD